jgi:hypothetical protein
MVNYRPTAFEIEKEWNTSTKKENTQLLEEMGLPSKYGNHTWQNLPEDVKIRVVRHVVEHEYIAPPISSQPKEVLEPSWVKTDCESHGGIWVPGFYREGSWVRGYCRYNHLAGDY